MRPVRLEITQPRRVAKTKSVQRDAAELGVEVGKGVVGYQVGVSHYIMQCHIEIEVKYKQYHIRFQWTTRATVIRTLRLGRLEHCAIDPRQAESTFNK